MYTRAWPKFPVPSVPVTERIVDVDDELVGLVAEVLVVIEERLVDEVEELVSAKSGVMRRAMLVRLSMFTW